VILKIFNHQISYVLLNKVVAKIYRNISKDLYFIIGLPKDDPNFFYIFLSMMITTLITNRSSIKKSTNVEHPFFFFVVGVISPKKEFKIKKKSDFGGFQLLEVRKKIIKFVYFLHSV
jgi:hypothetical protein